MENESIWSLLANFEKLEWLLKEANKLSNVMKPQIEEFKKHLSTQSAAKTQLRNAERTSKSRSKKRKFSSSFSDNDELLDENHNKFKINTTTQNNTSGSSINNVCLENNNQQLITNNVAINAQQLPNNNGGGQQLMNINNVCLNNSGQSLSNNNVSSNAQTLTDIKNFNNDNNAKSLLNCNPNSTITHNNPYLNTKPLITNNPMQSLINNNIVGINNSLLNNNLQLNVGLNNNLNSFPNNNQLNFNGIPITQSINPLNPLNFDLFNNNQPNNVTAPLTLKNIVYMPNGSCFGGFNVGSNNQN